jgi:hypothetical protein
VSASCTNATGWATFHHRRRAPRNTGLHPLARAWIAGLRHNSRHKFRSRHSLKRFVLLSLSENPEISPARGLSLSLGGWPVDDGSICPTEKYKIPDPSPRSQGCTPPFSGSLKGVDMKIIDDASAPGNVTVSPRAINVLNV